MALIAILATLAILLNLYLFFVLVGTVLAFLPRLVVGLIAGWITSAVTHSSHGVLGDIGIGLAGSIIGGVLYALITLHTAGGPLLPTHQPFDRFLLREYSYDSLVAREW